MPGEVRETIRGWTDNGKIMPPWITLSEQRETQGVGGQKADRERRVQVHNAGKGGKLLKWMAQGSDRIKEQELEIWKSDKRGGMKDRDSDQKEISEGKFGLVWCGRILLACTLLAGQPHPTPLGQMPSARKVLLANICG